MNKFTVAAGIRVLLAVAASTSWRFLSSKVYSRVSLMFVAALMVWTAIALNGAPLISTNPQPQFAWEGRPLALNVWATGTPPLSYQWQFNGAAVAQGTNRVFSMLRINLTNEGNYRVIVTDATGMTTSKLAQVLVRRWPTPTGVRIPELASLDGEMQSVLQTYAVPGGSLVVVKDGRLLFARGYGWADVEHNEPFYPDTTCRIASLSKMITTVALMRLVEEGKLTLDTRAFPLLNLEHPTYPGAISDFRLTNITVRHLLSHTAGWDRDTAVNPQGGVGFDPAFWPESTANDMNLPVPISPTDLVRWTLGQPLKTNPGAKRSYSNLGYLTAGRVVEKISGLTFESAAREFLGQAGITGIRVGGNTPTERRRGEAVYYLQPDPNTHASILPLMEPKPLDSTISYAYPITTMDSAGGLIASAIDYARFMASIDGEASYPDLLGTNSLRTMASGSDLARLGWDFANSPDPRSGIWWKAGTLFGSCGLAVKWTNGVIFVYLLNTLHVGALNDIYFNRIPPRIGNVRWPTNDFFAATLSYDAWRAKHFSAAELADPALSSEQSDPDNDGVPNISEYAHGYDPRNPTEPPRIYGRIRMTGSGNLLVLNFRRLFLAHELDYALEASSDLLNWSLIPPQEEETPALNADGTITASLNVGLLGNTDARFFRLNISRK